MAASPSTYKGEIMVLGLTKLMEMTKEAKPGSPDEFFPEPCYSKKTGK